MQSAIHEGYEYQDYFTVSIILQLLLHQTDAEIIIDRKDFSGDKFDDLKVKTPNGITEFQIKYSDDERSHKLTKDDFANGNGHDTALCDLFSSWKTRKESENDTQIKLCLAWNRPTDDDPIIEFLKPIQEQALPFLITAYSFDGEVFWPVENLPPKTWRKFNLAIRSGLITREDFLSFCNELTIILEMPKASLDLKNPGGIENVIIRQAEKLGVGIYPNNNLTLEDVIYKLAAEVKHSRAMGNRLNTNALLGRLGLIMDYGKFDQRFPVDSAHQIILGDEIERLHREIRNSKRVIITGNPGSGKSWLVNEYIDKLKNDDCKVIHYNCFQSLQDTNSLERICVDSLYGNLIWQIVEQCPELVENKKTIFGADKEELENLLCFIDEEFYLIVDGLDHISREYELHKDLISRSETEIISELLEIHFPDNCHVLISSQPIDELEGFKDKNYCVFEIEPWGIEQVKSLMATFRVIDDIIGDDDILLISAYLLKKSQGNALYLSYILRQLRNLDVNKELIDKIPDYDIGLSKYYSYLYTKVRNNRTVNALCGADFYLSLDDLKEITGDGEFVEHDISKLHPLLNENTLSGGFSIYHESFRRFVLSLLKEKKVDLERNVYGILADWLQEKPFFEFDKSFYYLTELLYKIKRDVENTALIEKEFVLKSVSEGYSRKRIRTNLNCIIRSAGRIRNLIALVTAGELLAMLDDMNEFESTGAEYFQAICDIKGASKLNQLMQIDGEPTFDKNTGRLACYISSKAGITPWWELYLDTDARQYKIEDFKYYFRYHLDEQGVNIIPKLMEGIEKEDVSIRKQCIEIAYDELQDYIGFDEIASIAEEQQLIHWKSYLSYIETGYYPQSDVSYKIAIKNWEKIKKLKVPGEEDIRFFKELFSQVYYLTKQGDRKIIEAVITDCENTNWFYNWIIYSIKMAELCAHAVQMNSKSICESAITNLELLLQDTEVFKGEPRTCDLYFLQNELTRSYEQAIELIVQNGTVENLEKALGILERLDDETGTSFDHSMGGPLTDAEFLKLIFHFLTIDNYKIVKPYLLRTQNKIEKKEVYDCIAAAKLRFVSLISKYNRPEALEYFDMCTRYLVAYGFHKDIILEQIMDSYEIFFESVAGNPEEERDTITKMSIALWNHTDGRETKHFLNRWFNKLLKTDPRYALAFLSEFQIKYGKGWVVERMLCSAIERYCNDSCYLDIVIGLIESLPNDTSPRIIAAATSVFRTLEQMCIGTDDDKRLRIKCRMNELVINVVSRFNILDSPWPDNDSWKDGSIKDFLLTVESEGFDVSQYIEYFHIKKANDTNNKDGEKKVHVFENNQTHFEALTLEDAKKWFETHDLIERDIQDICGFLEDYQDDKDALLGILKFIITKAGGWSYSQRHKDIILQIIERLGLDDKEMSEIHMLMYLYSYEWGSSLIDKDEFINSIRLSSDVGRDTFYRELPEVIISHSGRVTKGLLDALFAIGFDKGSITTIWQSVYNIMKLRFPNLDQYPIDNVLEEKNELLGLRNCLLMRFIDEGKESFLATYAYLANAAEEENYSAFTESIVFCLAHYEQYNLVTQIAIADLVRCYGYRLKDLNIDRMINAINAVYPTGNLLLDVIFSEFTIYKNFLLRSSDKHAPDYMEQEDIEFYLAEQLYDLGKEEPRKGFDEYAENSIYRDPVMQVVNTCGINYAELYEKLHASRKLNKKMQDFVGGESKIPEANTVYKSYVIQYALHTIIEKAFWDRKPELIPQNLLRLMPDYQGMYRLFKCRDMQPKNHLYEKDNSCEPFFINSEDEYILIGRSEIRKRIDYHQVSLAFAYQGIAGADAEEHQNPFQQCLATTVEEGEIYMISDNSEALISFISTLDRELEDEEYLWPGMLVSKLLNVHIEFDFLHGRYIAVNKENDIVFIMKKWSSSYKGDSEYPGNAIPLYSGTELYIKKEYIGTLEQRFGTLMMKTYVQSYPQTY
ncbi:MAG: NACHT domain-containing protein [Lachnospiraceae bacterium]|nr:NACHT domain-containing protein [Lachnospiraceae bacterium]